MRVPLSRLTQPFRRLAHRAWPRQRADSERGAVAVMTVVLLVVLVGMAAVVLDFGNAYWNKRQLSTAADAAALAAARDVALSPKATTCTGAAAYQSTAQTVAEQYVQGNEPGDGTTLSAFSVSCDPSGTYVEVRAQAHRAPAGILSGIFGVTALDLSQTAVAAVGTPKTITGLRPFALCTQDSTTVEGAAGPTLIEFTNTTGNEKGGGGNPPVNPCATTPGNWGILDFNGQGGSNNKDIEDWVKNGFAGPVSVDDDVRFPGDPGAPGAWLSDAMNSIVGTEVILPVFEVVIGPGNNAEYQTTRFLGVTVCEWKFENKTSRGAVPWPEASCGPDPGAPDSSIKNFIRVRYQRVITVGDINTAINFDDPAYAGLRVVQLIK